MICKGGKEMTTIQVTLNSIDKVKTFVNLVSRYDSDFDLVSGRYVIDAKSIMGIFSLDLSKPIELNIHDQSIVDEVKSALNDFIVE
jgi:phosphotransferase system HPr-like phosphotransfer protein